MVNKTAMQELLEWVRKTLPMDLDTSRMIEDKIESLLPVEKENMKHAFEEGNMYDYDGGFEEYHKEFYGK
jgi:hypothetical protein